MINHFIIGMQIYFPMQKMKRLLYIRGNQTQNFVYVLSLQQNSNKTV